MLFVPIANVCPDVRGYPVGYTWKDDMEDTGEEKDFRRIRHQSEKKGEPTTPALYFYYQLLQAETSQENVDG